MTKRRAAGVGAYGSGGSPSEFEKKSSDSEGVEMMNGCMALGAGVLAVVSLVVALRLF